MKFHQAGAVMVLALCSSTFALAGECELIATSQLAMDPSDLFRLAFVQQEQFQKPTLGISVSSAISLMRSPATRAELLGLDDDEIERIPWTLAENLVAKLSSSGYFSKVAVVAIDNIDDPGTDLLLSAELQGIALGTSNYGAIQILSRGQFTKASGMRVEFRLSDTSTHPVSQQFSCTSMKGVGLTGFRKLRGAMEDISDRIADFYQDRAKDREWIERAIQKPDKLLTAEREIRALGETLSPVALAARMGWIDLVRSQISANPEVVNLTDDMGYTALHWASLMGYRTITNDLLNAGARPNVFTEAFSAMRPIIGSINGRYGREADFVGDTPLAMAAEGGHLDILSALIDAGGIVDAGPEGAEFSALALATVGEHLEVVEKLIEAGADVDRQDGDGVTALLIGSQKGNVDTVQILLDKGADVNLQSNDGLTALMAASEHEDTGIVEMLRSAGAIDSDNKSGL